jgi:hypothetical protein
LSLTSEVTEINIILWLLEDLFLFDFPRRIAGIEDDSHSTIGASPQA